MILDTSAVVASLLDEADAPLVNRAIGRAESCRIGAPTLVETTMVMTGKAGDFGRTLLADFLQHLRVDILNFGEVHWHAARSAFVRYGKGRHKAALNMGDCLTYATTSVAGEPLLCIGDDFVHTDLELVLS